MLSAMTTRRAYGGVSAEERIAARRAKLLDAGLELFGTRGYGTTGVKDVCREAGLTDRYFYESFADSEALFLAVFDRLTDELFEAVAAAVGSRPAATPERQLRVGDRRVRPRAGRRPAQGRACSSPRRRPPGPRPPRTCARRCAASPTLVAATARAHVPPRDDRRGGPAARALARRPARARRDRARRRRAGPEPRARRRRLRAAVRAADRGRRAGLLATFAQIAYAVRLHEVPLLVMSSA